MSADLPSLPPEVAAMLNEESLLHARCGRRVAEHPYGSIHLLPCPYPELPPREFAREHVHEFSVQIGCDVPDFTRHARVGRR